MRELAHFGVPWTRVRGGKNSYFIKGERVEIEESIENDGLIMHRDFGGTAKWRACYAAAGTGHAASCMPLTAKSCVSASPSAIAPKLSS